MLLRTLRLAFVSFALLLAVTTFAIRATGQESAAPSDATGCTVTPLTDEEISDIRLTPDAEPELFPSSIGTELLATGFNADDDLATTLTGIVGQFVACTNAGNTAAVMALGTDDFVRAMEAPAGSDASSAATPGVAPARERTIELIEVDPVLSFSNGTAAAFAATNQVGHANEILIFLFVQEDDGWKIGVIVRDETFRLGEEFPADAVPATPEG